MPLPALRPSRDRFRGALLGLAVGDALGTTLEFSSPGTFEPLTDLVGGGPFSLEPGQWTDDTSMALCLAESLLACGGTDLEDQAQRYVRWWRDGHWSSTSYCFDIGNTVREALLHFEVTGEAAAGSTDPQRAGNGALMRLAPVALRFAADRETAMEEAARSSLVTHGTATSLDACRVLAALLVDALQGVPARDLLDPDSGVGLGALDPAGLHPEVAAIVRGSFREKAPPREIRGSGYVVRCLEAALWALHGASSFREACLRAVNLGDDADTTGAVCGQLAGAVHGLDEEVGIPPEWRAILHRGDEIEAMADALREAALAHT